jgi:cardiolipin synthase
MSAGGQLIAAEADRPSPRRALPGDRGGDGVRDGGRDGDGNGKGGGDRKRDADARAARAARKALARDRSALRWYLRGQPVYTGGNEVALLRGGEALFPAMCAAIGAARHEVWLATYIVHDDAASRAVVAALAQAARRGVHVSVVVDGFGAGPGWTAIESRLKAAGVHVAVFRPMHGWRSWLQPEQLRRLHQKLCVVDAGTAFVGGINLIDDRYDLNHGWSERPRLDFAVRVRGPAAEAVQHTARAVWSRASLGKDWRDEVAALVRSSEPVARAKRVLGRLRVQEPAAQQTPVPAPEDLKPVCAAFVVRDNFRQRRSIERSYVEAMRKARRSIDIVSPYFFPGPGFLRTLRGAAARGVRVRLLMQGRWDYRFAALAARGLYDGLLLRGVEIYEYAEAFLHAKVAAIDDAWATVGSSNIDPMSLLVNLEANVIVRDPDFVAGLRREIDAAIAGSLAVRRSSGNALRLVPLQRGFVAWCARVYLRIARSAGRF